MARRVKEYQIVTSDDPYEVARLVNQSLDKGWELYGELKVYAYYADYGEDTSGAHISSYSQVMVLHTDTEE